MASNDGGLITHLEWGKVEVGAQRFRDVKLFPGGVRAWDWRETGTRHVPGVQVADVEELIAAGSRVVILSRGMDLVLQVPQETIEWVTAQGARVEVLESRAAAARYNELQPHEAVGLLLHTTC